MTRRQIVLSVLGLAVILQCAVPVSMIVRREMTLRRGEIYRFKTAPVDPVDAFRGRYVALNFEQSQVPRDLKPESQRRQRFWARLGTDEDGFARIEELARKRGDEGDWIPVRVRHTGDPMRVNLPFDRYYMNENLAPKAELKAAQAARTGDRRTTYAEVRVLHGFPVLQRLIVDSRPVEDWFKEDAP